MNVAYCKTIGAISIYELINLPQALTFSGNNEII